MITRSHLPAVDALFEQSRDATPLSLEERDGLRLANISLRGELNEAEQDNIVQAEIKLFGRRSNPLKEPYGRSLHKQMFGRVWKWAGIYRTTGKNLGVPVHHIRVDLLQIYDDVRYWVDNSTFDPDEIAVRFHHKLVVVHPFPNGNGRWSRLMADLLLHRLGRPRFPACGSSLAPAEQRAEYIAALRKADKCDVTALMDYMRPPPLEP